MKQYLLLTVMLLCVLTMRAADADTTQQSSCGLFNKALWSYVTKMLPESMYDGKYTVFVVKLYQLDEGKKDISFTLYSIVNSNEYDDVEGEYYFNLGKEIFLVKTEDSNLLSEVCIDYTKIDRYSYDGESAGEHIVQRLYPSSLGFITDCMGYTEMYSIVGGRMVKRYAGPSRNIADDYARDKVINSK